MKNNQLFFIGLAIGLLGGIAGNIFVTSMYRVVDKNPQDENWLTFSIGLLVIIIVIVALIFSGRTKRKIK